MIDEIRDTPKPQVGTWALTAPDGRTYTGDSPLRCVGLEQRERVPPEVALERIFTALAENHESARQVPEATRADHGKGEGSWPAVADLIAALESKAWTPPGAGTYVPLKSAVDVARLAYRAGVREAARICRDAAARAGGHDRIRQMKGSATAGQGEGENVNTLGDQYPREQARLRELIGAYERIGPPGVFGLAHIRDVLARADAAAANQDLAEMVRCFVEMGACE